MTISDDIKEILALEEDYHELLESIKGNPPNMVDNDRLNSKHEERSNLYSLAANLLRPGKTAVLAWCMWHYMVTRPHAKIVATSITGDNNMLFVIDEAGGIPESTLKQLMGE